jgi:hypothetical protein
MKNQNGQFPRDIFSRDTLHTLKFGFRFFKEHKEHKGL